MCSWDGSVGGTGTGLGSGVMWVGGGGEGPLRAAGSGGAEEKG